MSVKTQERVLNVFIFIAVLALIFVIGYPEYQQSKLSIVRIGVDKTYGSVPFYMAKLDTSRRYFRIAKVEPEFIEMSTNPLQDFRENKYDIAAIPWYWLIVSPVINGDTLKVVGSLELKSSTALDAIIIPKKSRIKGLKDLKGKKIGFITEDEYLVDLILERMKEEKITGITKVALGTEEIGTALAEGVADALFLLDPFRGFQIYGGDTTLCQGLISPYIASSMPYKAIVMKKSFVTENRLAAIRVKNAVEAALAYLEKNPEPGKKILLKLNDRPPDSLSLFNIRMPEYQRLAEINLRGIELFQTKLVARDIPICDIKSNEFLFEKTDFARR